ncbi:MAG: CHAP domain-containing protein, partial [Bdellovibrionales bacterium]
TPASKPSGALQSRPVFYPTDKHMQCVPYARDVSGISIRGDAHTWWDQAKGRYVRTHTPQVGAVMVLSKTKRLKYGHVAVVKRIIDKRTIEVEHTNWGGDLKSRCVVYENMPVIDSSPNGDWSRARFYHYASGSFGSNYKVSGFILPD